MKVKGFYLSCKSGQATDGIFKEVHITDLDQNRQYFVYIVPILNSTSIGEVKNISIWTKLASNTIIFLSLAWVLKIYRTGHSKGCLH